MPLGINNFQSVSRGLFEREIKMENESVRTSSVTRTTARLQGWLRQRDAETQKQIHVARYKVKKTFIESLGLHKNDVFASLKAIGISEDFLENNRPLTNRIVKKMLHATQQYRKESVKTAPITLPPADVLRDHGTSAPAQAAASPSGVGAPAVEIALTNKAPTTKLWPKNVPANGAARSQAFTPQGLARLATVYPNVSELLEKPTNLRALFVSDPAQFASNMRVKWAGLGGENKALNSALRSVSTTSTLMAKRGRYSASELRTEMAEAKRALESSAKSLHAVAQNTAGGAAQVRALYTALAKDMVWQAQLINNEMLALDSQKPSR